jgi:hypothetical protein
VGSAKSVSPLLQWMRETSGLTVPLKALRRRLAGIPDSMADDIRRERKARF